MSGKNNIFLAVFLWSFTVFSSDVYGDKNQFIVDLDQSQHQLLVTGLNKNYCHIYLIGDRIKVTNFKDELNMSQSGIGELILQENYYGLETNVGRFWLYSDFFTLRTASMKSFRQVFGIKDDDASKKLYLVPIPCAIPESFVKIH